MIDKNALTETYVILTKLNLYNKIPKEFQMFIEENKNNEYDFDFNEKAPLFNQVKSDVTRTLVSYIYIKYINTSQEDMKFYKQEITEILKKLNK